MDIISRERAAQIRSLHKEIEAAARIPATLIGTRSRNIIANLRVELADICKQAAQEASERSNDSEETMS